MEPAAPPDFASFAARLGMSEFTSPASEGGPPPPFPVMPAPPWQDPRPRPEIKTVRWHHDAMIDLMIAEPQISQGQIASHFGFTQAWVSTIINSDAFKARLAERKGELVDPVIIKSIEERLQAAAQRSLDIILEKLDTANLDQALKVATQMTAALGYGARAERGSTGPQVAVVVNVPAKSPSAGEWEQKYGANNSVIIEAK